MFSIQLGPFSFTKTSVFLLCLICLTLALPKIVSAQTTSLTVGITYQIIDSNVVDGDVVCAKPTGYGLCQAGYDPSLYGIISKTPALTLENTNLTNSHPLVTTGKAYVRVNSSNGTIKKGDFLTSSPVTGVAMKAAKSGYVLGTAIDDYNDTNKDHVGSIVISVGVRPVVITAGAAANLYELIRQGIDAAFFSPISALRYLLAAFVVSSSFILGFIYFGRIAKTGIEALGRNPLASRTIEFGIFLNIFFMIVIVSVGMGISYLILIL